MSGSWAGGSSRRWRRTRAYVLARDGYTCQLRLPGCEGAAPLEGGHVHHLRGKATGDDPAQLVASCAPCNLQAGQVDPDPDPRPLTRW